MRHWTNVELEQAKKLRRERVSASGIGRLLGRTRNSVIGALHRAGEPGVLQCDEMGETIKIAPRPRDASPPRRFSFEDSHV